MGSGIATVLILNNFKVILKEVNEQSLSAGINRVKGRLFFPSQKKKCLESS
jgi:enoyl-CoA hydratase/3-hydroxyacyl-CoA dehydrogenase